jgi:hypothetical protein
VRSKVWVLGSWILPSWVRIPHEAWMFVLSFCVVLPCVGRDLPTGRPLVQGVLPTVEKAISKPPIRRWSRFFNNRTATGREREIVTYLVNWAVIPILVSLMTTCGSWSSDDSKPGLRQAVSVLSNKLAFLNFTTVIATNTL